MVLDLYSYFAVILGRNRFSILETVQCVRDGVGGKKNGVLNTEWEGMAFPAKIIGRHQVFHSQDNTVRLGRVRKGLTTERVRGLCSEFMIALGQTTCSFLSRVRCDLGGFGGCENGLSKTECVKRE